MGEQTIGLTYPQGESAWGQRLRAFRASHTGRELEAGGLRWSYLAAGQGPLALLLHGSESDAESLFGAMSLLERGYRVLAPTYPEDTASVEQACTGLAALIESACGGAALVVGYSLGGYLAQALASRRPDLVAGLALCNTGAPTASALPMVKLQYGLFAATPASALRVALRAGADLPLWCEAPDLTPADHAFWRAYLAAMASRISKRSVLAHGRMIAEYLSDTGAPPAALAQKPGRVLIIQSAYDHVIEPAERAALDALYPGAMHHQEPTRGHLSVVTHPEPFVAAITRMFSA